MFYKAWSENLFNLFRDGAEGGELEMRCLRLTYLTFSLEIIFCDYMACSDFQSSFTSK